MAFLTPANVHQNTGNSIRSVPSWWTSFSSLSQHFTYNLFTCDKHTHLYKMLFTIQDWKHQHSNRWRVSEGSPSPGLSTAARCSAIQAVWTGNKDRRPFRSRPLTWAGNKDRPDPVRLRPPIWGTISRNTDKYVSSLSHSHASPFPVPIKDKFKKITTSGNIPGYLGIRCRCFVHFPFNLP